MSDAPAAASTSASRPPRMQASGVAWTAPSSEDAGILPRPHDGAACNGSSHRATARPYSPAVVVRTEGDLMTHKKYSRRDVVKGGSTAVTLGMIAAAFGATLPKGVRAADSAKGKTALTILYPAGEGKTFNADYY